MSRAMTILMVGALLLAFAAGAALATSYAPIEGTDRSDHLTGTTNPDAIYGRKGRDTIEADQGGRDSLYGGRGDDIINVREPLPPDGAYVKDDHVDCGRGREDTAIIDEADVANESCESVQTD